jgi:hypothetical protein
MVEPFAKTNIPQVIGTGIWGWDELTPDFAVTFDNVNGFLDAGRKHGIIGMISTNWADSAQILYRMTMPGIACSAVAAWQPEPVERDRFFSDLMDTISGMREDYRQGWEAEYTPYRKQSALGRWDAEYEYWRCLQARLWEFMAQFKDHDPLPSLHPSGQVGPVCQTGPLILLTGGPLFPGTGRL